MVVTMKSSAFVDALQPTGVANSLLHRENKPVGKSEFMGGSSPGVSDDAKDIRHELVLRDTKELYVDQSQIKSKHGPRSRKNLQSNINPYEVATRPWSHMRRRRRRRVAETSLTFANRRILANTICTNKDISIFQSPDGSSGIPRYSVQIMNNCMSECAPSDIHLFCGWFASALLVNPNSFKRVAFDDCLVNGGLPLRRGETLRFTYANSFMYPLRFKSASFCK